MKIYGIVAAVVFFLPLFVLSYMTMMFGDTFAIEQWVIASLFFLAGGVLVPPFIIWCVEQDNKKGL